MYMTLFYMISEIHLFFHMNTEATRICSEFSVHFYCKQAIALKRSNNALRKRHKYYESKYYCVILMTNTFF